MDLRSVRMELIPSVDRALRCRLAPSGEEAEEDDDEEACEEEEEAQAGW